MRPERVSAARMGQGAAADHHLARIILDYVETTESLTYLETSVLVEAASRLDSTTYVKWFNRIKKEYAS